LNDGSDGGVYVLMNVQLMFLDGVLVPYKNKKCKYCGKPFIKTANRQVYCSERCRSLALKEQKAKYQRSRRKRIREGELVSNETKYVGTGFLSQHRQEDFNDEMLALEKEMRRLKIRKS